MPSSRKRTKDPLQPRSVDRMTGAAVMSRGSDGRSWEAATVMAYHVATHSADIRTYEGRVLIDVPQIRTSPRSNEMLESGTDVIISWDLGFTPIIVGCFEAAGRQVDSPIRPSLTGVTGLGDDNPLQPVNGHSNYRPPDAPGDMMEGDWARTGPEGQAVAVLRGGIAQMGSPTALVQSLGMNGLLRMVAQRITGVSDFGWWKMDNDGGKTSFILRAGANQQEETGLGEEHWTIRLDLGATGDLFNFEITDKNGRPLFRMHVDADGHLELYGKGGTEISAGDNGKVDDCEGDRSHTVGGDADETIGGNATTNISGSVSTTISGDSIESIGNDRSRIINRNEDINIGGNRNDIVAGGSSSDAKEGNIALTTTILNGGWSVDIGNTGKGASSSAKAGWSITTGSGDITLTSGGKLLASAADKAVIDGSSIEIGKDGSHPLPLFDTFLGDLGEFLETLLIALAAGTEGSPVAQVLTGLDSAQAALNEFVQNVLSGQQYTSRKAKNA